MKSLIGLSGQIAQKINTIDNITKFNLDGIQNNMKQLAVASNVYRNIAVETTMQLQKN